MSRFESLIKRVIKIVFFPVWAAIYYGGWGLGYVIAVVVTFFFWITDDDGSWKDNWLEVWD